MYISSDQHNFLNMLFFPVYISEFFYKISGVHVCSYLCLGFWFYSIGQHVCFFQYYGNLLPFHYYNLKWGGIVIPSLVLTLFWIVLAVVYVLCVYIWSWNCAFKISEELFWNFDEECIQSIDCVWYDSYFTLSIMPIKEQGKISVF